MMTQKNTQFLSVLLSFGLVASSFQILYGYQTPPSTPEADVGTPTEPAPQTADQLQALVAPIALYPDALVAQILAAATFPDQVAIANYWTQQNKNLTGTALTTAVNQQPWDPRVAGSRPWSAPYRSGSCFAASNSWRSRPDPGMSRRREFGPRARRGTGRWARPALAIDPQSAERVRWVYPHPPQGLTAGSGTRTGSGMNWRRARS